MAKGSPEREQMKYEVEINNSCSCSNDETGEPLEYCDGSCWEMAVEDYTESFLKPWLEAKAIMADSPVRIHGSAMGWLRRTGHHDTSARGILDALSINGDYKLVATYEDGELSFVRYSHDEPTGASFTLEPVSLDGESEWV